MTFKGTDLLKKLEIKLILLGILLSFVLLLDFPFLRFIKTIITIYILLFLPGLAIIINFYDKLNLANTLLSIVLSYCFWTFFGFIAIPLKIPLTKALLLVVLYIFIISNLVLLYIFKFKKNSKIENLENIHPEVGHKSSSDHHINSNFILLILFLSTLAIFCAIRVPYVPYEDDWYHMAISNYILENKYPQNTDLYWGRLSYQFIGSSIALLSDLDIMIVARFIGVIQLPLGCILFYKFLSDQIKNQNLAILITIAFSLTIFGTILNFTQYWPTATTTFFGLQFYIIFFKRMQEYQNKVGTEKTHRLKTETSKNIIYFTIQSTLLLSMMFTHVINAPIYLAPIIFALVFITIRDRRFLRELIFYTILFLLNILINPYFVGLFLVSGLFDTSRILIFGLIFIPIFGLFLWRFEKFIKNYSYSTLEEQQYLFNPKNTSILVERKYHRKYIIPIILLITPFIFYFVNINTKQYFPASLIISMLDVEIFIIIISGSIIAYGIYRDYNIHGKINFLYMMAIFAIVLALIFLGTIYTLIVRMIELYVPFFFIGFAYYVYYNFNKWLKNPKHRKIMLSFFLINLFSAVSYQTTLSEHITPSENRFVYQTSFYTQNSTRFSSEAPNDTSIMIIGGFRWKHPYAYYTNDSQISYKTQYGDLIHLENQFSEGINQFKPLQDYYGINNYFILIEETYTTRGILTLDGKHYGQITDEELFLYNNQNYINRVAISNHGKTLYWIILS